MPIEQLRKQWDALGSHEPLYASLSFVNDWLVLGAGTKLASARRRRGADSDQSRCFDAARVNALLSAAYEIPIDPVALGYIQRAIAKHIEGEATFALAHLAMTGLWRLREPRQAAYRLYMADGLMKAGLAAHDIMRALGFGSPPGERLERYGYDPNQPRVPAGNGIHSGRWGDGSGRADSKAGARRRQ